MHAHCIQCRTSNALHMSMIAKKRLLLALSLLLLGASGAVGKSAGCSPAKNNKVALGLLIPHILRRWLVITCSTPQTTLSELRPQIDIDICTRRRVSLRPGGPPISSLHALRQCPLLLAICCLSHRKGCPTSYFFTDPRRQILAVG